MGRLCTHTLSRTRTHTHTRTHMHAHMHTTHAQARTGTHAHSRARTHRNAHTHTRTRTRTRSTMGPWTSTSTGTSRYTICGPRARVCVCARARPRARVRTHKPRHTRVFERARVFAFLCACVRASEHACLRGGGIGGSERIPAQRAKSDLFDLGPPRSARKVTFSTSGPGTSISLITSLMRTCARTH